MAPLVVVPAYYISPETGIATITFTDGLGFSSVFKYVHATGLVDIPERATSVSQLREQIHAFNDGNRKWLRDITEFFNLSPVSRGPLVLDTAILDSNRFRYKGTVAGLMLFNSVYHKDTGLISLKPRSAASITLAQLLEFIDGNAFGLLETHRL